MPLTAEQARDLLLVRAFETPPTAPWTEADARWASEQAQRSEGSDAANLGWLRRRATVALERLGAREPRIAAWRRHAAGPPGLVALCVVLGLVVGVAGDAIGSTQRINILAPPLVALLAWNLGVYLVLLLRPFIGGKPKAGQPAAAGPLRTLLARLARLPGVGARSAHPALARFATDWGLAARPLAGARLAQALHAGAAALALGALASMYLRGLAFEYRAGWESTFLASDAVAALLQLVLGPAAAVSGIALPDAGALEALRFSTGGGENAARWIHLYAITVGAVVVLPRLLLAAWAGLRARWLAGRFPLALDDPYFERLLRAHRDTPVLAQVLPYSYRLPLANEPGLHALLDRAFGPKLALHVAPPLPLGAEDAPERLLPAEETAPDVVVALLPLASTPERENHGAFLESLARVLPAGARLVVLIDESGFHQRLSGADAKARLAQRRQAWQRLLADTAIAEAPPALFSDLSAPDLEAGEAAFGAPAAGRALVVGAG